MMKKRVFSSISFCRTSASAHCSVQSIAPDAGCNVFDIGDFDGGARSASAYPRRGQSAHALSIGRSGWIHFVLAIETAPQPIVRSIPASQHTGLL